MSTNTNPTATTATTWTATAAKTWTLVARTPRGRFFRPVGNVPAGLSWEEAHALGAPLGSGGVSVWVVPSREDQDRVPEDADNVLVNLPGGRTRRVAIRWDADPIVDLPASDDDDSSTAVAARYVLRTRPDAVEVLRTSALPDGFVVVFYRNTVGSSVSVLVDGPALVRQRSREAVSEEDRVLPSGRVEVTRRNEVAAHAAARDADSRGLCPSLVGFDRGAYRFDRDPEPASVECGICAVGGECGRHNPNHSEDVDGIDDRRDAPAPGSCCECCVAAAERGELDHELGRGCPHPPCDVCPAVRATEVVDRYGRTWTRQDDGRYRSAAAIGVGSIDAESLVYYFGAPAAPAARCSTCGGLNGSHGLVHRSTESGGRANVPCPDAGDVPADALRCDRFFGSTGEPVDRCALETDHDGRHVNEDGVEWGLYVRPDVDTSRTITYAAADGHTRQYYARRSNPHALAAGCGSRSWCVDSCAACGRRP